MTECPKCGGEVAGRATECARCGVVFEKLERRIAEVAAPAPVTMELNPPRDMASEALSGVWWSGR